MATLADQFRAFTEWVTTLPDWQAFLVIVGSSLLAAAVTHVCGDVALKRLTSHIPGDVDDIVLQNAHVAIWSSVGLAGLYFGAGQLDIRASYLQTAHATTLTAITLIWAWTLARTAPAVLERVTESNYLDQQVVPIVQNVWNAVVAGLSLFLILSFWNINVTPLLASAGVLGIVVGLAARDTIANFFGSLALYADGTFTIGDYIVLESGERGRVEDISIRSTVIRTRDDILVTIPNSELNSAAIINESDPQRYRRITVPVGVAYGSDIDEVEEILLSVAESTDTVRETPTPRVFVKEFGDSAINMDLLCWIDHPRLRERVQDELFRGIYERFEAEGIDIPFPQRSIRTPDEEDLVPEPLDPTEESTAADGGTSRDE